MSDKPVSGERLEQKAAVILNGVMIGALGLLLAAFFLWLVLDKYDPGSRTWGGDVWWMPVMQGVVLVPTGVALFLMGLRMVLRALRKGDGEQTPSPLS